uniref:NADH dehydrogenase subunit 4L n=1 Tax=Ihlea magalhanica TaxID=2781116 RepID=A0AA86M3U8_9UROC|nr:NADH dehydrogenase subunit 4L [Ihlea magalhanica]
MWVIPILFFFMTLVVHKKFITLMFIEYMSMLLMIMFIFCTLLPNTSFIMVTFCLIFEGILFSSLMMTDK